MFSSQFVSSHEKPGEPNFFMRDFGMGQGNGQVEPYGAQWVQAGMAALHREKNNR